MHAKQMAALDEVPAIAAEFETAFGRSSGGLLQRYRIEDAETVVVALGSVLGTVKDVVDGLRDEGRPHRRARHHLLPALAARRGPGRAAAAPSRVVVVEKALAVGAGGIVGQNVRHAPAGFPLEVYDVVAGLGGRPITRPRCARCCDDVRGATGSHRLHFLDLDHALVQRELERRGARPGPCGEHPARPRHGRRGPTRGDAMAPADQVLPDRHASRSATGCSTPSSGPCRRDPDRTNSLTSGHRACQGCGEALGARYVLDAAMRATGGKLVAANATGCLEVFSTPYPESSWQLAVAALAVRQRARPSPPGIAAALQGARAARTSGWWARPATAAPSTSASAACPACSSATTTCSSSATTTRAT